MNAAKRQAGIISDDDVTQAMIGDVRDGDIGIV
jgi:hypothetical protein